MKIALICAVVAFLLVVSVVGRGRPSFDCDVEDCVKCHPRDADRCLKCDDGYALTAPDTCSECEVDDCVKCNPRDVDKCSICADGFTLSEDETSCEGDEK